MTPPLVTPLDLLGDQNNKVYHKVCIKCACFGFSEITSDIVMDVVRNMKSADSVDIYDLSSNIIKKVIDCILEPIVYLINRCLNDGIFPKVLKLSRVVPIYKKGDRSCPASYRPVSLTPVFSKIIEAIIHLQFCNYLSHHDIICKEQFGFIKGKSTVNAMDLLVKKVMLTFENRGFVNATFCDLSKAFDCVNHDVLLDKLVYYGVSEKSLSLFRTFLVSRQQIVCIGNERSDTIEVKLGVPQGSVLGPLLFVLMINDLPPFLNAQTLLYADDTTFLNFSSDFNDLQNLTHKTITQAAVWFRANGFVLNDSKTQQMCFSLRDLPVKNNSDGVKFLGLYLDSKLTWEPHVNFISIKLSRVIYLIRKLKDCVPDNYVRSAYFAFFQSIISYGILLWGNSVHIQRILILQKKVVRIITDSHKSDHCKPLFVKLGCLTIINLYIYNVLMYIKNNISCHELRKDIHNYNTRLSIKINVPFHRLSKSLNSYEVLGLRMYNELPSELTELPSNLFKCKLYTCLVNKPFYSVSEFFDCRTIL
jgi:hypothetical protein